MQVRLLRTLGNDSGNLFDQVVWDKPEITDDEIEVRAVMTGVCRSDIDMMLGGFGPLPLNMQGHEGLGQVTKVGANIIGVAVGDYVATRGEPAYADYYNVRNQEFVAVPEAHPRYILEPVACGVNVVTQCIREIAERSGSGKRLLIMGSGFLAWVAYRTILLNHLDFDITVFGHSNRELWGDALSPKLEGTFDVIIDLSPRSDPYVTDMVNSEALVIFGSQKTVETDFRHLLWKACTIMFPSPRTQNFYSAMQDALMWVQNGDINVDKFWTQAYNRDTEWFKAFLDGVVRPQNYSRGYIQWQ